MKIVLLDAKTLDNDKRLDSLKDLGEFVFYDSTPSALVYERCKDADIIVTNKVIFDAEMLKKLPKLKLIAITATGTNIIDLETAKELNIAVKNVAGYSTKSVAQHTLTMALILLSQMPYYDAYCKSGAWARSDIFTHLSGGLGQMEGKKWGIIGMGEIGREVARIASCMGAEVSYTSISGNIQNLPYTHLPLEDLLKQSDIISIHSPLTPQTHNLINETNLPLLKKDALLINSGRGGIVNEEALAKHLKEGRIYFGADVLEVEPMKEGHVFLDTSLHARLLLTPHIAWAYENSRKVLIDKVIANIKDFLQS